MKLHLPVALFHALIWGLTLAPIPFVAALVSSAPAYALAEPLVNSGHTDTRYEDVGGGFPRVYGGAYYSSSKQPVTLGGYSSITISSNTIGSSNQAGGAAIASVTDYGIEGPITEIKDNGDVLFADNLADGHQLAGVYGGAIFNDTGAANGECITNITRNADVTFRDNVARSTGVAGGGAVYNGTRYSVVDFTDNDDLLFISNACQSAGAKGGAILNYGHLSLNDNTTVTFEGNSADGLEQDAFGGAMCLFGSGTLTSNNRASLQVGCFVKNNGAVTFLNNTVKSTGSSAQVVGGALSCGDWNTSAGTSVVFQENGAISFIGNVVGQETSLYAFGGAIASRNSDVDIIGNGYVLFQNNIVLNGRSTFGGALYLTSSRLTLSRNAGVGFVGNSSRSGRNVGGGAVSLSGASLTLSHTLGGVSIKSNSAISQSGDAEGGAFLLIGDVLMEENDSVVISDNLATAGANARGGAVRNGENCVFSIVGDTSLKVMNNKAEAENGVADGGAFHLAGTVTMNTGKESIIFSGNLAQSGNKTTGGGAVYMARNGRLSMSSEGDIVFSSNQAVSEASDSGGGALGSDVYTQYSFNGTGGLSFVDNLSKGRVARGGAVYYVGTYGFTITEKNAVSFERNQAVSTQGLAEGGAMKIGEAMTLSGNGDILFSSNKAHAQTTGDAFGGALQVDYFGSVTFSENHTVQFTDNESLSTSARAFGGAINTDGMVIFSNNGSVSFLRNSASAATEVRGGAVSANRGLSIRNNESVLFRSNYCRRGDTYVLNAIQGQDIFLTAQEGKTIEFYDAVSGAVLSLNETQSDAEGIPMTPSGLILFSGKYTESDLKEIKGGVAGTAEEIRNSRSSTFSDVTLHGGRLRVEEQAVVTARRYIVKAGTGVEIDHASLASNTTWENTFTDCSLVLTNGGALTLGGRLTLSGKVTLDVSGYAVGTHTLIAANGVVGADLLDISYTEGKREVYDIAWDDKKTALTLTVTKLGRTEPLTHLWTSDFKVLSDGQTLGDEEFMQGDTLQFNEAAAVTVSGTVKPAAIVVDTAGDVTFTDDSETPGNIAGACTLTKSGGGTLTLNGGNSYTGNTTLNAGTLSASAADSFGQSTVKMQGGALNLGGYGVSNAIIASGGTLSGATAYTGVLTVQGNLTIGANTTAGSVVLNSGSLAGGSLKNTTITAKGGSIGSDILSDSCLSVNGDVSVSGALSAAVQLQSGTLSLSDALAMQRGQSLSWQGGELTGDVLSSAGAMLFVTQDGALQGNLTLNGGELKTDGHTLDISGALSLLSSTQLNVSAMGVGRHDILTFGSMVGSLDMLELIGSPYIATLEQGDNSISVLVKAPVHTLQWNSPKGIWSAEDGTTWDLITEEGIEPGYDFHPLDIVEFRSAAKLTIRGTVEPGSILVDSDKNVTFSSDKKVAGSGIIGDATLTKDGAGLLTMNAGNTYTGGTTLNAGTLKATAADSFGVGTIAVKGGTLDLGSKAVANDIVLSGEATLKGDAKYTGAVTVDGDATLLAKASYKGMTTIGAGSTLTLAPKATMAGSITLDGGTLNITAPKGMTLAKNMTMQLNGGSVSGLLTIGTGSTLVWQGGSFDAAAPVLKGGTVDLGGWNALILTGSKAQVQFGDKALDLPGKGTVRTNDALTVNSGTVTVNSVGGYEGEMTVNGGTLKLSTGKMTTENDIVVNGTAAVVNGGTHYGNITVDGLLAKGTNIKLLDEYQKVALNGDGTMLGTISGKGIIDVNADITATAAKLTAATINLNSGTFTNTKGIKLAKGQTLTLAGASLDLGPKGALATVAGSTLVVDSNTTLTGSLTLGGGELVFNNTTLELDGTATLTLSKAMTVTGSGTIHYTTLKAPKKLDLEKLFGEGVELDENACMLTFNGGASLLRSAAAPLATAEEAPAQLDATPAIPVANPVADAMVQADWGILDAERAFMGAVNSRSQHAALLDKGRGAAWVSAFGASVRHGNQGTHHGSDGNIEGAAFGLEHAVSETGSLGLVVGRSKNRLAATGVTHLRQETAHVALYGQKQLKHGFTADAAATYGDTETKLSAASWTQKSAALTARLTHAQQVPDATVLAFRTFGGLAYEATDAGSIGTAHTGSVQNLRAELGAGITHTAGKAHLYAEASLTGDLVRHNPTADLGGARTHGANPGRLGLRATVGGIYEFSDTWSGTASYGLETESRSTSHTLNIGVSKSF